MITTSQIIIDLDATSKNEAIEQLIDTLVAENVINDKTVFFDDLGHREKVMSTYCGNGISIPHAVSRSVNKPSFAFAKLKSEFVWGEEDENTKYIILLAIPFIEDDSDTSHIDMMSSIAGLALDEEVVSLWENASTSEEIFKTFISIIDKK